MGQAGAAWTSFVPVASQVVSSPGVALQVPVAKTFGRVTVRIVTRETIDRIHHLGKVIHVWTIDDPSEMNHLIDLGVDGIITDRPDLLKEVLVGRNLWE